MLHLRILLLASTLALLPVLPGFAQDANQNASHSPAPVLRVSGTAEVGAEPDMATFEIGANITDASASKAMSQAGQITDRMVDALLKMGVPRDKFQTTSLRLNRQWENIPGPDGRPTDKQREIFMAVHNLQLEVGKDRFNQIGELLDAGMKAGANYVGDITFGIRDDSSLQDRGLAEAVKSARRKADVMAKAAGVSITGIANLQENGPMRPIPFAEANMRTMALSAPSPVPPSEIKRTYLVTVDYSIR